MNDHDMDNTGPDAGSPLSDAVPGQRAALPLKPAPVVLTGDRVILAPLDVERDVEHLHVISNGRPTRVGDRQVDAYDPDEVIWRYMSGGPFATSADLAAWLRPQVEAADGLCLLVADKLSGQPIGVANFIANVPAHLKVELGSIWYSPLAQRTGANTEATYLMLRHAFGLGYRRVEWKCDTLNRRSRAAALRMGFMFEGIQHYHYVVKGRNRNTAWFRVLDSEWPEVMTLLEDLSRR